MLLNTKNMTKNLQDIIKLIVLVLTAQLCWGILVLMIPIPIHKMKLTTTYLMGIVSGLLVYINYKDKIKYEVPCFVVAIILNYFVVSKVLEGLS